jgi:NADPH-dependent 2,4-dienoyl-CoA reductase/sulfur reductase-like enzyme
VLLRIAQNNGIHYQSNTTIRGSQGNPEDDQVRNIVLTNKNTIPSDLIILGIGVQPVTDFVGDLTIDSKVFHMLRRIKELKQMHS